MPLKGTHGGASALLIPPCFWTLGASAAHSHWWPQLFYILILQECRLTSESPITDRCLVNPSVQALFFPL